MENKNKWTTDPMLAQVEEIRLQYAQVMSDLMHKKISAREARKQSRSLKALYKTVKVEIANAGFSLSSGK